MKMYKELNLNERINRRGFMEAKYLARNFKNAFTDDARKEKQHTFEKRIAANHMCSSYTFEGTTRVLGQNRISNL